MAYDYAKKTNNREAIALLRKVYKRNPNEINVNYSLGICYMNGGGNPDSALFFLKRVKELDDDPVWSDERSELYMAIARAYQLKYDFDTPNELYDIVAANDPNGDWTVQIGREREICSNAKVMVANPVKLEVKRMNDFINSAYNDYRPVVSNDQKTLYFTSRRKSGNEGDMKYDDGQFEEAIYSVSAKGQSWGKASKVKGLFENRVGQQSATCLANNDTELYLVRDDNVYVSVYDSAKGEWGVAEMLPEPINMNKSKQRFAFVTPDGTAMYLSSPRELCQGGIDIYFSYRLPNGNWGVPKNLGPTINTPDDEDAPIMHPTQDILYFSSRGHNSMGGMDIYYTLLNPDSTFTAVKNIGYPINTPDDDLYFVPTAEKNMAYYASIIWDENKLSNCFDIYQVEYEEPEVNRLVVVEGFVNASQEAWITIVAEADDEVVGRYRPNPNTKKYIIILEVDKEYHLTISDGDLDFTRDLKVTPDESFMKSGHTISLGTFDFVKYAQEIEEQKARERAELKREAEAAGLIMTTTTASEDETPFATTVDTTKPYTVQFLCLREACDPDKLLLEGVEQVHEYEYRDGWYVYSFGQFEKYNEAVAKRDELRSVTAYSDAFVRKVEQYKRFVK